MSNSTKLTKQQNKVYEYILNNPGCTTHDIQMETFISCPSARITELRKLGINIIKVGKMKYKDAHPFERYAIKEKDTLF